MVKEMLLVNMKAYDAGTGDEAVEMAEKLIEAKRDDRELVIAVQPSDIARMPDGASIYAEHVDPVTPGSHTGTVLPEAVKDAGAEGTLINHSEHRLETVKEIEATIRRAEEAGLETVVCAQSPEECREISSLEPDYIAYEPPELIGGDTAVSEARPELIEDAVEESDPVPALTGAGIKERKDVEKSLEKGCKGVLVASGVVKSENPGEKVENLMGGL